MRIITLNFFAGLYELKIYVNKAIKRVLYATKS